MVSYLEDRQALVKDLKHLTNVCVSYAKVHARSLVCETLNGCGVVEL